MKNYGKLTLGLIVGWLVFAFAASALRLFTNDSNRIGFAVALAASVPILIFAFWFAMSRGFRNFTLSLNPRALTVAQTGRILGFVFVLLEARGALPAVFAKPAGYGDMLIGITASLVGFTLAEPKHRSSFIGWQVLGITDLILAVGLGVLAPVLTPDGALISRMTILPLSLVPTFLVPLFFIFHVISIAQARSWRFAATDPGQSAHRLPALAPGQFESPRKA